MQDPFTPRPAATSWRGRADGAGKNFILRWGLAVALAMTVAGVLEYTFAAHQLERRIIQETTAGYVAELSDLEEVLATTLTSNVRQQRIDQELTHISRTYGTQQVALFDAAGSVLGEAGEGSTSGQEADTVDPRKLASVTSSQQPLAGIEQDEGEAGEEGRYEFLLPVMAAEGTLVLEVDQNAGIIGAVLADVRLHKALGLLLAVLLALPLSYLLGGRALHRRQQDSERTADTDALTGLAGRRPFRPSLEAALADPAGTPVALALIDIDEFKQVNDRHGHSYGDRVLIALAESCSELRSTDRAFRLGGDEFAVLLPDCEEETAAAVIDRVRESLAARVAGTSFSYGIASTRSGPKAEVQELWERSDAALYKAKRRGRRVTPA